MYQAVSSGKSGGDFYSAPTSPLRFLAIVVPSWSGSSADSEWGGPFPGRGRKLHLEGPSPEGSIEKNNKLCDLLGER